MLKYKHKNTNTIQNIITSNKNNILTNTKHQNQYKTWTITKYKTSQIQIQNIKNPKQQINYYNNINQIIQHKASTKSNNTKQYPNQPLQQH
jgi:hypothetical protein